VTQAERLSRAMQMQRRSVNDEPWSGYQCRPNERRTGQNLKRSIEMKTTLATLLALALLAASANAAAITVTNHGFEDPVYAPGVSGFNHPGWTDLNGGNAGTGRTTTAQYPSGIPEGVNYAWFNQAKDTLGQTLAATLQADTTYTLTVATGWRTDLPGLGYTNYPGYRIELWAGGTMLGFDADTTRGGTGTGPAAGTWKDVTVTYTSPSSVTPSQALEIRLLAGNAVNGGTAIQTNYDNVRLDATPIPEPASLALMGLAGLMMVRRKK